MESVSNQLLIKMLSKKIGFESEIVCAYRSSPSFTSEQSFHFLPARAPSACSQLLPFLTGPVSFPMTESP